MNVNKKFEADASAMSISSVLEIEELAAAVAFELRLNQYLCSRVLVEGKKDTDRWNGLSYQRILLVCKAWRQARCSLWQLRRYAGTASVA